MHFTVFLGLVKLSYNATFVTNEYIMVPTKTKRLTFLKEPQYCSRSNMTWLGGTCISNIVPLYKDEGLDSGKNL